MTTNPLIKTKQWHHQKIGTEHCIKELQAHGGVMLAADMGTGKSKMIIDTIVHMNSIYGVRRVLIVCPKAVVPVWPSEFKLHCAIDYRMIALSSKDSVSTKTEKAHTFLSHAEQRVSVIVINYESSWRAPFGDWLLKYYQPQVVAADESHKLKGPGSKCSLFYSRLGNKNFVRCRMGATGTPMASPLDLYAQYRFIDPKLFGYSFAAFKARYVVTANHDPHIIVGYKNLDELNAMFNSRAYSVRADDVLDLPPYKDEVIFAEMNGTSKRIYRELDEDLISSLPNDIGEVKVANAMTKILHLQQVTSGFAKSDGVETVIDDGKLLALSEFLDGIPDGEPVVIFTRFILDASRVHAMLAKRGRKPCYQTGADSQWEEFRDGLFDSIVVNVSSGGAGISLVRAKYAIYYSVGYGVLDYQQSRRRLVRPGQDRPVTFYHICVPKTVDQHIYTIYRNRLSAVSHIDEGMISDAEVARGVLGMMRDTREEYKKERKERTFIKNHGVKKLMEVQRNG